MRRQGQDDRLQQLVQAATQAFLAKGYRRTQIADVARIMGVAPGTVYLYAQSKEALFELVLRASLSPGSVSSLSLPVPTPPPDGSLKLVKKALKSEGRIEALEEALRASSAADVEAVLRELFRRSAHHWLAIKLVERSALDWPELADTWFVRYRRRILDQLTRFFEQGVRSGILRRPPSIAAAARLVLEMNAFLAIHRRLDPYPTPMDETLAEETFVDAVLHAYGRTSQQDRDQETDS
jgi:AcrR family transcriptional regulator